MSNLFLLHEGMFFQVVLGLQLLFHILALIGWFKQKKHNLVSVIKIPFYFNFKPILMNNEKLNTDLLFMPAQQNRQIKKKRT